MRRLPRLRYRNPYGFILPVPKRGKSYFEKKEAAKGKNEPSKRWIVKKVYRLKKFTYKDYLPFIILIFIAFFCIYTDILV